MRKLQLANTDKLRSTLKHNNNSTPEHRYSHRLHCVLLVGQGCSCYQVAQWFGEHPRTIERWVHYVQELGIEGLKDERITGRPPKLEKHQRVALQKDLTTNPSEWGYESHSWNGKILQHHIKRYYAVELSIRQCQRLIHLFST